MGTSTSTFCFVEIAFACHPKVNFCAADRFGLTKASNPRWRWDLVYCQQTLRCGPFRRQLVMA
jgi:hypothetical protein